MRNTSRGSEAGFTLVELTIVVVISTLALIAIYQSLITQERTYRYQTAAIDAQGSSRTALSLLASELREISASAGDDPSSTAGSDLLVAARDSVRFRVFRKVGITCGFDRVLGNIDVWVPGEPFAAGDAVLVFLEGDSITDEDDRWATVNLSVVGSADDEDACTGEWGDYPVQGIGGLIATTATIERGAILRSFERLTYGAYQYDGDWVLGRRNSNGNVVPLVGPLLSPDSGGIRFRYFDVNNNLLTPSTESERANVSRIEITVRALSPGGLDGPYVDSLSTNVYLRGN